MDGKYSLLHLRIETLSSYDTLLTTACAINHNKSTSLAQDRFDVTNKSIYLT